MVFFFPEIIFRIEFGVSVFVITCLFVLKCVKQFAKAVLFDKEDPANLQVFGGIRFGDLFEAIFSGKSATWPFAKLSASHQAIRLQTPFGNYSWDKCDLRLIVRKAAPSAWRIGREDAETTSITFFSVPWESKMVDRKLKELGYEVRS